MLSKYLKVDCTDKIRDNLALPSFWDVKEPRDWTAINYIGDSFEHDPALTKRIARSRLSKDVKYLRKWVALGTIAETKLNSMDKFTETKAGKTALTKFYEEADVFKHSGIKQRTAKTKMKASMMQEAARDEEERVQKKRRTEMDTDLLSGGDHAIAFECDVREDGVVPAADQEKHTGDIWKDWKRFLEEAVNNIHLPGLSPEKHGVVWYGPGLRRRPSLPENLYARMKYAMPAAVHLSISSSFKDAVKTIIQSDNRPIMLELIETLRTTNGDAVEKKFLIEMFSLFAEQIYDDLGSTLSDSETCLNGNLIKPSLQICTRTLRRQQYDVTYFPGEVELESMTEQLRNQGLLDHRFKYNADGKIRINRDRIEPLLLEVSSAYKQASQDKIAFDHSKAMFGLLSILKTIACRYQYGSFDSFRAIKVHFLHVHGTGMRHWSMMTPEPGVYIMTKEQKAEIPICIGDMASNLLPYIRLHLNLTAVIKETLDAISRLREEHQNGLQDAMIDGEDAPSNSLVSVVNPTTVRLNEGKHTKDVVNGPLSAPTSLERSRIGY